MSGLGPVFEPPELLASRVLERGLQDHWRGGALELLAIDVDVDPLVEEADQAAYLGVIGQRDGIASGDVLADLVARVGRPVVRLSLVGAQTPGLARGQQVHPDVLGQQIIAGEVARLEDQPRPPVSASVSPPRTTRTWRELSQLSTRW